MALGCSHYENNTIQATCSNSVVVSVIVPVYNVEDYLERCLNSIIRQTFSNMEIICVDDGSTDRSGELLDKYAEADSRIIVIHKENGGVSTARNTALACVKGRFVYFIDSDDWIESNAIEEFVSCMKEDVDVVVAGASVEDEGGDTARGIEGLNKKYAPKRSGVFFLDDSLIKDMTVVVWDKLFRSDIIRNNGIIFPEGRKFEDTSFTVEYLVHSKKVFFTQKRLYHYVRRPMSITTRNYNDYTDKLYVFDHLYKRLEGFGLLNKYKNTLSFHYLRYLKQGYEGSPLSMRGEFAKKATALAQHYDATVFNSDLVSYIKEGKYSRVAPFDKDVVIVLKAVHPAIENAFKTVKSLFAQSYKLPKVMLMVAEAEDIDKEDFFKNVPKELTNRVDKELLIEFSSTFALQTIKQKYQDYVLMTVENGKIYSPKWLYCVMAAYLENKDTFKCLTFDNSDILDDEILFQDFAVIDVDASGKVMVLKSQEIIVSVTSYPARIRSAALAIETIFDQTRNPDRVVLWLAASQFPKQYEDLPKELLGLVSEKGLEIQWCDDDLKPHKKYFYAFQRYPDALVITIDDDILYPPQRIENLYLSYLLHPYAVAAARAHLIAISEAGTILPYKLWPQEIDAYVNKPSLQLCATGCGGVLYPTTLFSKVRECLLDKEIIKRSCLYADDLWLKGMELVAGIPLVVAEEFQDLCYAPDSQDVGLWHKNVDGGENDRQLLQIEEEINQRYGSGTFRKKLLDATVGVNLVGAKALSNLIRFYKVKAKKQISQVKKPYEKYTTLRMDIRNRGDEGCDVVEQGIVPPPLSVRRPQWLTGGMTVESIAERMTVAVQCKGDGELEIDLMGTDVRNEDGKRYPVWIDCTYFAVNGEVIFAETKTICHDKRYVYRKPVVDGGIVTLDVTWSECRSSNVLDEYRQLESDLKKANSKARETGVALKNADGKVIATEYALKNAKDENVKLNLEKQKIAKDLEKVKQENAKLERDLKNVKNGWSFKIGRVITWLPRRIKK